MADQSTNKFIQIVKSHSILWDLKNPDYKYVKKKADAWQNVSDEFGLPTYACKKKWKGLRDSCARDLNRKTSSNVEIYESEPCWKYRDQMEFIRDHMNLKLWPRAKGQNIKQNIKWSHRGLYGNADIKKSKAQESKQTNEQQREMRKKSTEKFIEIVKYHDVLWNLRNPNHKYLKKKAAAWKSVSEKFGLSPDVCKKKWKALRDSLSRDLNKKPTSGQDNDDPDCCWKYREHMEFIREHMNLRLKKSKVKSEENLTYEDGGSDPLATLNPLENDTFLFASPRPQTPEFDNTLETSAEQVRPALSMSSQGSPERQEVTMESSFLSTMETVQDFLKKRCQDSQTVPITPDPDEDELFCQSLVKKIKKFPRDLKNNAKLEMLRYLNEVESMLPDT